MSSRITWIRAGCVVVLAGVAFVAVSARADPPNTGMADPSALLSAFDHFAAGGAPANVVVLSLSNLRGVSSEALNAGGRVTVDLAAGTVGSAVQLLPPDGTFDLWLIDNQPGSGHTTLAEDGDGLMKVGTYAWSRVNTRSRCPWIRLPSPASSPIGRSWSGPARARSTGSC